MNRNRTGVIFLATSVVLALLFGVISLVVGDWRVLIIGLLATFPILVTGFINFWLGRQRLS